jgi:DMSO/TMAO reductase YedYZ molybdopterin-dependent catalytic subunit
MRAKKLSAAALALCLTCAALPSLAGGPLLVVPTDHGLQSAKWQGTVNVYTDLGTLGVVDNPLANQLVKSSLQQWSSVPTSSFRAQVVGTMTDLGLGDITGANAASVIGADNGGGIQVIFDGDGSVTSSASATACSALRRRSSWKPKARRESWKAG